VISHSEVRDIKMAPEEKGEDEVEQEEEGGYEDDKEDLGEEQEEESEEGDDEGEAEESEELIVEAEEEEEEVKPLSAVKQASEQARSSRTTPMRQWKHLKSSPTRVTGGLGLMAADDEEEDEVPETPAVIDVPEDHIPDNELFE
jgi:hypothetical protein